MSANTAIVRIKGTKQAIKNCYEVTLKNYISGLTLYDFAVESLTSQDFCQAYITRS